MYSYDDKFIPEGFAFRDDVIFCELFDFNLFGLPDVSILFVPIWSNQKKSKILKIQFKKCFYIVYICLYLRTNACSVLVQCLSRF